METIKEIVAFSYIKKNIFHLISKILLVSFETQSAAKVVVVRSYNGDCADTPFRGQGIASYACKIK